MFLRNGNGSPRAQIRESAEGQRIYTPNGQCLGYYNERLDRTYTLNGQLVGSGNQLTSLL